MGRRTVSHVLVLIEPLSDGHWSDYHRVYSAARFSVWQLAAALTRQVIALLPRGVVIELVADDTVDGKDGDHVWAKGTHRDSARSSRKVDQNKFGHKWLVLCVLVRIEGLSRPWALPVLCGMCISPKVARQVRRRPKTASDLTRQLLMVLMRWLPDRTFVLVGDYQVITHKTACFAARHRERVTVVGRLRGDANFYHEPTPEQRRRRVRGGGCCTKGKKAPSPAERVARLPAVEQEVNWYGGGKRKVRQVSETVLWFSKQNCQAVPIRWVCVLGEQHADASDDYFYSSDATMTPQRIVELYVLRWNIEVTFEEARQLLGLETTRHWCKQSVLRVAPLILGLFTAVTLMWHQLPAGRRSACSDSQTPCYHKRAATFADALFAVRHELWEHTLLRHRRQNECLNRLPKRLRQTILHHLAAAA